MSERAYFTSAFGDINPLKGASGEEAFRRALELSPRQGYLGDFLFGYSNEEKSTRLSSCFPSVIYPGLGDAVFLNYTDESEREQDQGIGWAIRHGDGEQLYEIHEGTYAYERNFMPEAIAIQALDHFLKTGERDPNLSWEPFEFYDPEWEEFCKGNDSK